MPICFVVTEAARWRILAGKSHLQFGAGERLGNAGGHTPALLILSTAADEAPSITIKPKEKEKSDNSCFTTVGFLWIG